MHLLNTLPQRLDPGATPTFTGLLAGDGTAAAPSLSFAADPDTGFYRNASGQMGFSANGAVSLYFGTGGTIQGAGFSGYLALPSTGAVSLVAAGTNQNITLTPSGSGVTVSTGVTQFNDTLQFNASGVQGVITWDATNLYLRSGSSRSVSFQVNNTGTTVGQFLPSGRFLVGTGGVDSGALLQVGTNLGTKANGLVLGTDTFLHRNAAGRISLESASDPYLNLAKSGTILAHFLSDGVNVYAGSSTGIPYILRTNNTTALTLDSSQNATFAGAVSIVTTNVANPLIINSTSANLATLYQLAGVSKLIVGVSAAPDGINNGSVLGDPCFRTIGNILFSTDGGTTNALKLTASTGAATFAGAITTIGGAFLLATSSALTAGATSNVPTLTSGPVTGNPTKWIAINDNGTTRYVPAW
jgi:hypothetical protein